MVSTPGYSLKPNISYTESDRPDHNVVEAADDDLATTQPDVFGNYGDFFNPVEGDTGGGRGISQEGRDGDSGDVFPFSTDLPTGHFQRLPGNDSGMTASHFNMGNHQLPSFNTTRLESDVKESQELTSREVKILLGTLIPAFVIILILSVLLFYVICKLHKRTFSRIGMANENKTMSNDAARSSGQTNGHAHRSRSRNSEISCNGHTNGSLRAWEENEVSVRQEQNNHG